MAQLSVCAIIRPGKTAKINILKNKPILFFIV